MPVYCSLHHENPDGSAFCDECGEPLASVAPGASAAAVSQPAPAAAGSPPQCSSGRAENPAGEAYCANGGVSLLGAPAANPVPEAVPAPAPEPAVAPAAEPVAAVTAAPEALAARLI